MTTVTQTAAQQPDIQYAPSLEKYQTRTRLRLQSEDLPKTLPPSFPQKLSGDLVWEGENLQDKYDWVYELSASQIEEIETALAHFKCRLTPRGGRLSLTTTQR